MGTKITKEQFMNSIKKFREVKAIIHSKDNTRPIESRLKDIGVELYCPDLPLLKE